MSTSRSVSSTSIGGSQLGSRELAVGCKLKNCRRNRSARASESIASDNIQLTGSLVDICSLAFTEVLKRHASRDPERECKALAGTAGIVLRLALSRQSARMRMGAASPLLGCSGGLCPHSRHDAGGNLHCGADRPAKNDQPSGIWAHTLVQNKAGDGCNGCHCSEKSTGSAEQLHGVRPGTES